MDAICYILRYFDHDLLMILSGESSTVVHSFLSSEHVSPLPNAPGLYQMDRSAADQSQAIAQVEGQQVLPIHTHAFIYTLKQMNAMAHWPRELAEEACFYHLDVLRLLLAERREWGLLQEYVDTARAAKPDADSSKHLLVLCDGFIAIRSHQITRGIAILNDLLTQTTLSNELRIRALNALGHAAWFQNRFDQAIEHYRTVFSLAQHNGDHAYEGHALLNISLVHRALGQFDLALEQSLASLDIFRALDDAYRQAHVLNEVGINAMQVGRWTMAREYIDVAIDLHKQLQIIAGMANLYWTQGSVAQMIGDYEAAEHAFRNGLEIAESPLHGEPVAAMDLWMDLGLLLQISNRAHEAVTAYEFAITTAQRIGHSHTLALIHYRHGKALAELGQHDLALNAYREAISVFESLRGSTTTEEIKIPLLGTIQQLYEAIVLAYLEKGDLAMAFEYAERARSRAFLDQLIEKTPDLYEAAEQDIATLSAIQAALPEDALLLEYYCIGVRPRSEQLAVGPRGYNIKMIPAENTQLHRYVAPTPYVLIFAITRTELTVKQVQFDPNVLRPQPTDPNPTRRLLQERMLTYLSQQLIAPIEPLLANRQQLYIIPHGPLHYVPFAALYTNQKQRLLDPHGPALAAAPSATILLHQCLGRAVRTGGDFLALGYNAQGDRALHYAESEAAYLERLLHGEAWIGPEDKSARLLQVGEHVRWIHIAGHAVYSPDDPLESALQLGENDWLSAHMMMNWVNLQAELVTLSACLSGMSNVAPGDELLGIQRALLYAGVPTLICTLWEGADFVTLLLMEHFYLSLQAGVPPAAALRDAQVYIRDMRGRDVAAAMQRWQQADLTLPPAFEAIASIPPEQWDTPLFADPVYWAAYLLIGRGA